MILTLRDVGGGELVDGKKWRRNSTMVLVDARCRRGSLPHLRESNIDTDSDVRERVEVEMYVMMRKSLRVSFVARRRAIVVHKCSARCEVAAA